MAVAQPNNNSADFLAKPLAVPEASASTNQSDQSANNKSAASSVARVDTTAMKATTSLIHGTDKPEINKTVIDANASSETSPDTSVPESDKNAVKRVVDEVVLLMSHIHEAKQEIIARGIPFHTVNVLVELGAQGKIEEQAKILQTALESSKKQYGPAAITAEKLDEHLASLIGLEKDLGLARRLADQQGLDMSSINSLTLIIRQNPGDGGEKTINTFLAYAMACDIPLYRIDEIRDEVTAGPKSVLPDIPRDESPDISFRAKKKLITDICVGCLLALLAIMLLT